MTVERVGEPEEDGQCAVVLSTDRYLSETTLLRRQTVELVFDSREGIRVPTESIRVVEQTVTDPETEEESQVLTTGVFVLVGQQAERSSSPSPWWSRWRNSPWWCPPTGCPTARPCGPAIRSSSPRWSSQTEP